MSIVERQKLARFSNIPRKKYKTPNVQIDEITFPLALQELNAIKEEKLPGASILFDKYKRLSNGPRNLRERRSRINVKTYIDSPAINSIFHTQDKKPAESNNTSLRKRLNYGKWYLPPHKWDSRLTSAPAHKSTSNSILQERQGDKRFKLSIINSSM